MTPVNGAGLSFCNQTTILLRLKKENRSPLAIMLANEAELRATKIEPISISV